MTIDTGFTGGLKLSEETVDDLGLQVTHAEEVQLGDGSSATMGATLALVDMEGKQNVVEVLISPGDAVAGVGLFKKFGYKLLINCKNNEINLEQV